MVTMVTYMCHIRDCNCFSNKLMDFCNTLMYQRRNGRTTGKHTLRISASRHYHFTPLEVELTCYGLPYLGNTCAMWINMWFGKTYLKGGGRSHDIDRGSHDITMVTWRVKWLFWDAKINHNLRRSFIFISSKFISPVVDEFKCLQLTRVKLPLFPFGDR